MLFQINGHIPDLNPCTAAAGSFQHFFHTDQKLQNFKRFDDIIFCAAFQTMHFGEDVSFGGEIDNRNPCFLQIFHQGEAIFSRQHNVHQRQCGVICLTVLQQLLRLQAIVNRYGAVSCRFQIHADQFRNGTVIFNYQNFHSFPSEKCPFLFMTIGSLQSILSILSMVT